MDPVYNILFVLNDILNIIVKCVGLMALHCYIIYNKGDRYEKFNRKMEQASQESFIRQENSTS
jgi:hypothetical protein